MRVNSTWTIALGLVGAFAIVGALVPSRRTEDGESSSAGRTRFALERPEAKDDASDVEAAESEPLLRPTPRHVRLLPLPTQRHGGHESDFTSTDGPSFSAVSWSMPWRPMNSTQEEVATPHAGPRFGNPMTGGVAGPMEPNFQGPVNPGAAYGPASSYGMMDENGLEWFPVTSSMSDSYGCNGGACGRLGELDLGGPWREPSAGRYRIRGGDTIQFTFQQTREQLDTSYRLAFGDQIRVSSDTHPELNTSEPVEVMPDGTISIPGLQSVEVSNLTLAEARMLLEEKLVSVAKYNTPRITLLPVRVYQRLNDLLAAVSSQFQNGGQNLQLTVIRDGSISLPLIGSICVVGLTREELASEVNARYGQVVRGIEVTVNITQTSPAFVYVLGQVSQPGRLEARLPMTVWQAIAQAGGHLQGAKLENVVILRRTEDWRLVATSINLAAANRARPNRFGDIFLWDSDVILVPKSRIQRTDELINMYLTQGIYAMLPGQLQFDQNSIF